MQNRDLSHICMGTRSLLLQGTFEKPFTEVVPAWLLLATPRGGPSRLPISGVPLCKNIGKRSVDPDVWSDVGLVLFTFCWTVVFFPKDACTVGLSLSGC